MNASSTGPTLLTLNPPSSNDFDYFPYYWVCEYFITRTRHIHILPNARWLWTSSLLCRIDTSSCHLACRYQSIPPHLISSVDFATLDGHSDLLHAIMRRQATDNHALSEAHSTTSSLAQKLLQHFWSVALLLNALAMQQSLKLFIFPLKLHPTTLR